MKVLRKQQGISLIEMMVSMSIGLLLLLGLGSIYVVANKANKDNEILSANAEVARQVFDRLNYDFKRAGFVDLYDSPAKSFVAPSQAELGLPTATGVSSSANYCPDGAPVQVGVMYGSVTGNKKNEDMLKVYKRLIDADPKVDPKDKLNKVFLAPISMISCGSMRPVFGCDGSIERLGDVSYPDVFKRATCNSGDRSSIEITYQAARNTSANTIAATRDLSVLPASAQNCSYDSVDHDNAEQNDGFIINRYFIENATLKCQGNVKRKGDASPLNVELVQGVQEMAFRYVTTVPETNASVELVNSDSGRVVTEYRTANNVTATALGWSGVVAVEVCLVVSTPILSGAGSSNLSEAQGGDRPVCARDAEGNLKPNKEKENANAFYQRYIRTFSLPNALYAPIRK